MRVSWGVSAVVTAVAVVALGGPASADQVTVEGTDLPASAPVSLAHVGCDDLYAPASGPVVARVGPGPGTAPLGARSLGFSVSAGTAVAAASTVSSVGSTPVSVDAWAASAARGVAYVVYAAPDQVFVGRAPLALPGGGWQTVTAGDLSYTWADGTTATVADFTAAHGGDGRGLYVLGFGCDGTDFRLDALRTGATTYDLEGITTSLSIDASATQVTGRLSTGTGAALPRATVLLESRVRGEDWQPVAAVPVEDGRVAYDVRPDVDTDYRWRFVDRPLAEGSVSDPVTVPGAPAPSSQSPMTPEPAPGQ